LEVGKCYVADVLMNPVRGAACAVRWSRDYAWHTSSWPCGGQVWKDFSKREQTDTVRCWR